MAGGESVGIPTIQEHVLSEPTEHVQPQRAMRMVLTSSQILIPQALRPSLLGEWSTKRAKNDAQPWNLLFGGLEAL